MLSMGKSAPWTRKSALATASGFISMPLITAPGFASIPPTVTPTNTL